MTTAADIARLPERQLDVLGHIAIGQDGGHRPRTLAALEAKGLIVSEKVTLSPRPGVPAWMRVRVRRYYVPLPVHAAWCEWRSQQEEMP